jgi:sodium/hydrogen exchanger 8
MATTDAQHEFGALNTLLLVVILGLCIWSAYLIKQNAFYYLPESAAAIVVGIIVGGLARLVYPSTEELNFLTFEPELFFFLLLPPIIFEAAYALETKSFFANFWTITLYTVFGTIISTFIIGYLVYYVALQGIVSIDTTSPMEALVFGSLLSAVDPVATLSIMGNPELNCDPLLYSLVFGESVLNDAVAIVLFKTFMRFHESNREFDGNTIPTIMVDFTVCSLGSVVVGIAIGLSCSYLCKRTKMRLYPEYEISLLFLFAYGSYSFAEAIELSGIMSLFFCGIVMSHYNRYNLSPTSQVTAHTIFKSMAVLSEYFVFLYIGMGVFTDRYTQINITFFLLVTVFCLISRMFNIFPLSWLANLGRAEVIPLKMQVVMWFAGLRGAIAFALVSVNALYVPVLIGASAVTVHAAVVAQCDCGFATVLTVFVWSLFCCDRRKTCPENTRRCTSAPPWLW